MPAIGAVWFDDPKTATTGWASKGGDAERIKGIGNLSTDTLWITNVGYKHYRSLNLTQSPHIYDSQYLRSSIMHIAKEFGLEDNPEKLVKVSAKIFNRVVGFGGEYFGINPDTPVYRYVNLVADSVTPAFMRKTPKGKYESELLEAFKQATQQNQGMTASKRPFGSTAHNFYFPRSAYAKWLLASDVPIGSSWTEIKKKNIDTVFGHVEGTAVKGSKAVIERLMELGEKNSVFLRVAILHTDSFYRSFATFSTGANYPRRWATLPEVLTLSRFCKISISGGFMTQSGKLPLEDKLAMVPDNEFSYSRGLFLENLWVSLATPIYGTSFTPVGAYLRAYDRMACLSVAESFASSSFVVGSYGTGRVTAFLRNGEDRIAGEIALKNGVFPPLSVLSENCLDV